MTSNLPINHIDSLFRQGNFSSVIKVIESLSDLDLLDDDTLAQITFLHGSSYYGLGDFNKAYRLLTKSFDLDRSHIECCQKLVSCSLKLNRNQAILHYLDKLLVLDQSVNTYVFAAKTRFFLKDYVNAKKLIDQAFSNEPSYSTSFWLYKVYDYLGLSERPSVL